MKHKFNNNENTIYNKSKENQLSNQLYQISQGQTSFLHDWSSVKVQSFQKTQVKNFVIKRPSVKSNSLQKLNYNIQLNKKNINLKGHALNNEVSGHVDSQIFAPKYKDFESLSPKKIFLCKQSSQKLVPSQIQATKSNRLLSTMKGTKYGQQNNNLSQKIINTRQRNIFNQNPIKQFIQLSKQTNSWKKFEQKQKNSINNDFFKRQRQREDERRINELIKNKVRRKRTNKFIVHRQMMLSPNQQSVNSTQQDSPAKMAILKKSIEQQAKQKHEVKLLKGWLDTNRYKKKRSIGSLLNQHFQNRCCQIKRQKQKTSMMRSSKFIELIAKTRKKTQ